MEIGKLDTQRKHHMKIEAGPVTLITSTLEKRKKNEYSEVGDASINLEHQSILASCQKLGEKA